MTGSGEGVKVSLGFVNIFDWFSCRGRMRREFEGSTKIWMGVGGGSFCDEFHKNIPKLYNFVDDMSLLRHPLEFSRLLCLVTGDCTYSDFPLSGGR